MADFTPFLAELHFLARCLQMDALLLAVVLVVLALAAHLFRRQKFTNAINLFPGPRSYPLFGNGIDLAKFNFSKWLFALFFIFQKVIYF